MFLQYTTTLILSHHIYIYISFFIFRTLFSLSRTLSLSLSLNYQLFYNDKIDKVFFIKLIVPFFLVYQERELQVKHIFGFQLFFKSTFLYDMIDGLHFWFHVPQLWKMNTYITKSNNSWFTKITITSELYDLPITFL